MFESVSNGFCPKEAPFIFLPLTYYKGGVAKLTWSWVTDIKIPRHTFYFINIIMDINHWTFQGDRSVGVAITSIHFFLRWGHLTWSGNLPLSDLGLNFSHVRKRCISRCAKNGRAPRLTFLDISENPEGGIQTPPPPLLGMARVNIASIYLHCG